MDWGAPEPNWDGADRLVLQCDQAVAKCVFCGKFGHGPAQCPSNRAELEWLLSRESPPMRIVEAGESPPVSFANCEVPRWWKDLVSSVFWAVCWATWGFLAGWVGAEIWRAG
jgi:hypothetical protein